MARPALVAGRAQNPEHMRMLALFALPILMGLVVGWLCGGQPGRLKGLRLRHLWIVWIAALIQACQYYAPWLRRAVEDDLGVPMLLLVYASVGLWLAVNLPGRAGIARTAIILLIIGGATNGLVILANGRMPFSVRAAQQARVPEAKIFATDLPKNEQASVDTRLAWLGDVLPVRPIRKVISAGDVAIMCGIALLVIAGMQPRPAPGRVREARRPRAADPSPRGSPSGEVPAQRLQPGRWPPPGMRRRR